MKENSNKKKTKSTVKKTTTKKPTTTKKVSSKKTSKPTKANEKKVVEKEEIKVVETEKVETPVVEEKTEKVVNETFMNQEDHTAFILRVITIILATILIIVAGVKMYMEARDNHYSARWENKSYLVEKQYAKRTTCEEISNIINGENKFVLVTNLSEEEFELEKDLAKLIKEYHLEDMFYVYPLKDDCKEIAMQYLQIEKFEHVPAIYYYRKGLLNYKVQREDEKMIELGDFQKLLDIYEFKK